MIRHISIFTFLDTPEKQQNIETIRGYLEKVPEMYPAVKNTVVAVSAAPTEPLPNEAPVMFGDLIQIADFDTPEDAGGYAPSKAHQDLVALSTPMLKKVTAIDFEM